jgi:hypothetical protein
VASVVAYLATSAAVRSEVREWKYRGDVIGSYVAHPTFRALGLPTGVSATGLAMVIAYALVVLVTGMIAARAARRGDESGAPIGWAYALAVAVLPGVLLALLLWPDGRGMLGTPMLLAATIAAGAGVAAYSLRGGGRARDAISSRDPLDGWARVMLATAIPLAIVAWLEGWSEIRGFDSFGYHLPLAASWLGHARLATGPAESLNLFYPGDFELLVRWTLATGTDRLAFVPSFASACACLWVLYRICLEIGQPRTVAAVSALAASSLGVLVMQSTTAYSDTFATLALLLAAWLLLRWWGERGRDARIVVAIGLALGVAVGTKYSALPSAVPIVLAFAWGVWRFGGRRDRYGLEHLDARWARRQLALLALPLVAASIYWYARNAIEHGNPFYPVAMLGLPGLNARELIVVRPELASPGWRWLTYPWGEWGFVGSHEDGLGPLFGALALPGLLLTPFVRSGDHPLRRVLAVVTIGSYALWLRTGILVPRYGLLPLVLSFAFVGELWIHFGSTVLRALTTAGVVASALVLGRDLVAGTAYVEMVGARRTGVPAVVDSLPGARILNAAGQPGGYYAMGRDYRHDVVTLYRDATPDDVRRIRPDYLLLPETREREFTSVLPLTLVARASSAGMTPTSLWRVAGANRPRD